MITMHAVYYKKRAMSPAMSEKEAFETYLRLSSVFRNLVVKKVRR